MDFLKISKIDAHNIANNPVEKYTPALNSQNDHFFYKDMYTSAEQANVYTLTQLQMDGLTPIDPTKPMFPRKK